MLEWIELISKYLKPLIGVWQSRSDKEKLMQIIARQQGNPAMLVVRPVLGSEDHEWAERMVLKKVFVRQPAGMGYSLSGYGEAHNILSNVA